MNIFECNLNTLNIKDLEERYLLEIKNLIEKELKRRNDKDIEEYRKSKKDYLGKYFVGQDQIIKILDYDFKNQYAMICLVLEYDANIKEESIILSFDSLGLFCNDIYNFGYQIIDRYKEISEEEFKSLFESKIKEICFGEFKCQG